MTSKTTTQWMMVVLLGLSGCLTADRKPDIGDEADADTDADADSDVDTDTDTDADADLVAGVYTGTVTVTGDYGPSFAVGPCTHDITFQIGDGLVSGTFADEDWTCSDSPSGQLDAAVSGASVSGAEVTASWIESGDMFGTWTAGMEAGAFVGSFSVENDFAAMEGTFEAVLD